MLHSERMRLAVVAGEKGLLTQLIHFLHTLGRIELVSAVPEETAFMHSAGSHTYFPVERYLNTVQSIKEYLQLKPPPVVEPVDEGELVITLPEELEMVSDDVRVRQEQTSTLTSDFLIPVGWTDGFPERVWRIFRVTNGLRRLSFLGSDFRMIGHAPDA
ncbi:MAG: hypothetical protein ABIF71_02475, partial [Planctomycetota bacterium]